MMIQAAGLTKRHGEPIAADRMTSTRRIAVAAGVFFLITEVTALAALSLYHPLLHNANYVLGAGADTRVLLGGFFEVILAMANIGTAVTLYPVVKRHSQGMALGFVAVRTLEAAMIFLGVTSLLSIVHLREGFAGSGADSWPVPRPSLARPPRPWISIARATSTASGSPESASRRTTSPQ